MAATFVELCVTTATLYYGHTTVPFFSLALLLCYGMFPPSLCLPYLRGSITEKGLWKETERMGEGLVWGHLGVYAHIQHATVT